MLWSRRQYIMHCFCVCVRVLQCCLHFCAQAGRENAIDLEFSADTIPSVVGHGNSHRMFVSTPPLMSFSVLFLLLCRHCASLWLVTRVFSVESYDSRSPRSNATHTLISSHMFVQHILINSPFICPTRSYIVPAHTHNSIATGY